jgi:hypothetical protein
MGCRAIDDDDDDDDKQKYSQNDVLFKNESYILIRQLPLICKAFHTNIYVYI